MRKILTIGAGTYQAPLIKRIKDMGIGSYCVDRNPNAVGFGFADGYEVIDVCDKDTCLDYARRLGINGIMTYGATLTLPTVAYVGNALGLPALSMNTAEVSRNKYAIKKRLLQAGLNTKGNFFRLCSIDQAKEKKFIYPCVIKPSDGSGSKGVSVVHSPNELEDALNYAFSSARYGEIYCEEFVDGEEYSVEAFVDNGKVYIYAIVKSTFIRSENDDISYGHRTPSGLELQYEERIENEVRKAVKALDITMGSVNFDIILSNGDKKPYIIDVGIRVGQNLIASHLIPLSRGVDVMDCAIRIALGEKADTEPKRCECVATRLLIYTPGTIKQILPYDDIIGKNGVVDVVLRKGVGDVLLPYKEKSDTCGWVIAKGNTPDEAEANAAFAKETLKDYIIIEG